MPFVLPVTVIMTYCPLLCLIFFNARIYLVIRQNAKAVEKSENKGEQPRGNSFKGKAGAVLAMVKVQRLAAKKRRQKDKQLEESKKETIAAVEKRTKMATDLHDVSLTHKVTLITSQSVTLMT